MEKLTLSVRITVSGWVKIRGCKIFFIPLNVGDLKFTSVQSVVF